MALLSVLEWADALVSGRPVLYGEGAVAHAAILLRDGAAYRDAAGTVAANYPPLFLGLSSLGDPFRVGRAITMASALSVALIAWWRARDGGPLAAVAIALTWLALAPVAIWGAAVKPDLLAVAATFAGVALLERSRGGGPGAFAAGALLELALWAKPTAALPALAVLAWTLVAARRAFVPALAGLVAVAALAVAWVIALGPADVWRHVILWNALSWSAEQALLLGVIAAATVGLLLALALVERAVSGIALAYVLGAAAIALLGGREGATINYLLDLAAAFVFALARIAPRLRRSAAFPIAAAIQLAIGVSLLTPFGVLPGRVPTTGAWGRPERAATVSQLGPGTHLVEDSGLLVVAGRDPAIDDLYLWSRLATLGRIDPVPVIAAVQRGSYASIVSEADLTRLDAAPAYERARWHPALVSAIVERYALERTTGILWIYRPR